MTKIKDMKIKMGGLMRCCTTTLIEMIEADENHELAEGETIDCKFETIKANKAMIVEGNVIRWNRQAFME